MMPVFAEKQEDELEITNAKAEIEILREVTTQLKKQETNENQKDIGKVIRMYNNRISALIKSTEENISEKLVRRFILQCQLENTFTLLTECTIHIQVAFPYLIKLNKRLFFITREKEFKRNMFYSRIVKWTIKMKGVRPLSFQERREQKAYLQQYNNEFIVAQLDCLPKEQFPQELVDTFKEGFKRRQNWDSFKTESGVDEGLNYAIHIKRESFQK